MTLKGILYNIQRFSIHDGPGIRTTVFLKGCPLRCFWCHNPEGLKRSPEIQFFPERCIACGECVAACDQGAQELKGNARVYRRERCEGCGRCVDACYAQALELAGMTMTAEAVAAEILKDKAFFDQSGGGVTLSGGEPLLQIGFSRAILAQCRAAGVATAIETTAHAPWETLAELLPVTDLVMMDLKQMDSDKHRAATGVSNELILANAARLAERGTPLLFRTPVVPGVNDTPQEIGAIARFIREITELGRQNGHYLENPPAYELLPFHDLAAGKYRSLGMAYRAAGLQSPTPELMERLEQAAREQ